MQIRVLVISEKDVFFGGFGGCGQGGQGAQGGDQRGRQMMISRGLSLVSVFFVLGIGFCLLLALLLELEPELELELALEPAQEGGELGRGLDL